MARLDRLGDDGKRTVQLASVIGRQFLVRLLARVAGLSERLEGLLHELQALEIIYEQGLLPEPAYIFKHAVIQDVAYNSLLIQRRKALHQAVGEAIEELYQDRLEEHYAELAHHFSQGEVWDKALGYLRQAGARAAAHSANREAVAYLEQALAALQHLPESHDTLAQAIDLRIDIRQSLYPLGELGRVLDYLREAEALATALGDQHRLGWVFACMTNHFFLIGNQDRAVEFGQRALAIAEAGADLALQVETSYRLGQAYLALADYRRAIPCFERNMRCLEGDLSRERFGLSGFPAVLSREWLVWILAEQGAFAKGRELGDEMVHLAEAIGHPFSLSSAYMTVGHLYLRQGDLDQAIAALERSLEGCQVWHLSLVFPFTASSLGAAYALAGRLAEALPLLEQAVERAAAMRLTVIQSLWITQLSEAYLLAGRMEAAFTQARRALELARAHQERGHEAWAHRLLGDLHAHQHPPAVEQTEAAYQQALALAEALGMRPLLAHCHYGLGLLYTRLGRPEQARAELSVAIELYRAMEMTFWLPRAETALAQVEG
jgi:tetratricopeptide (TPR) repeat protein